MRKFLVLLLCPFMVITSFACSNSGNATITGDTPNAKTKNSNSSTHNVVMQNGTYVNTQTYIASTGQNIHTEDFQFQALYVEDNNIFLYTEVGALWSRKSYTYVVNGNKILCTPVRNTNALANLEFTYDEAENKITWETTMDLLLVFTYSSTNKPIDDNGIYEDL